MGKSSLSDIFSYLLFDPVFTAFSQTEEPGARLERNIYKLQLSGVQLYSGLELVFFVAFPLFS